MAAKRVIMTAKGILMCSETADGKIADTTKELITAGRKLCDDLGQHLNLLLIGSNPRNEAEEAISLGVDRVCTAEGSPFTESLPEHYLSIIVSVCEQTLPAIIMFSQTDMGRDMAPRLGARLGGNVCLDCIELAIDPDTKSLLHSKPVYGGNAVSVWAPEAFHPQVITLRPRVVEPATPDTSRQGEIIPIQVDTQEPVKNRLIKTIKKEIEGVKLEDASVIVAGGGGIAGKEGFVILEELARLLGGAVGISRVPRDEGWMPDHLEIGQTGHFVAPNLYIAVGISGAPQHMAGCSNSKHIIAINKDPEAHVFKEADVGIVGDYREVLPELIKRLT
jgi:electron transfer flavoprotein alpha subunit